MLHQHTGTHTTKFTHREEITRDRMNDVTYGQFVCSVQPEKAEPNRTIFTVCGNRINYPGEIAAPTVEMIGAKLLFNSVISTKNVRFVMMDITNFYLTMPLIMLAYIHIKLSDIPDEITKEYNLMEKATKDGSIYIMAIHRMYGLPHAGLLANELLQKRLNKHGYRQSKLVPNL